MIKREQELKAANENYASSEQKRVELQDQINQTKQIISGPKENQELLRDRIQKINREIVNIGEEIVFVEREEESLKQSLDEKQSSLNSLASQNLEEELSDVSNQINIQKSSLDSLQNTHRALSEDVQSLENTIKELESREQQLNLLDTLTSEADAKKSDLEKAFDMIMALEQEADSIINQLAENSTQAQTEERSLREAETLGNVQEDSKKGAEESPINASQKDKRNAQRKAFISQHRDELEKRRADVQDKASTTTKQLESVAADIAKLETKKSELEERQAKIREQIELQTEGNAILKKEEASLLEALKDIGETVARLKAKRKQMGGLPLTLPLSEEQQTLLCPHYATS